MLFNSLTFLWFFLLVYALYLVLNHRRQNHMLLVASLFFYGSWNWRFLALLIASIVLDYFCGIWIHEAPTLARRRLWLAVSMTGNLGMLCFFKYYNFFADSFAVLLASMGFQVNPWSLNVILPVGISFYTFQTLSYTIDIYRRQLAPTYSILNFALFVSFFPQLVAGPIERAKNLLPQMEQPRTLNLTQIREGLFLIGWGLFQKVVIADHVAKVVNTVFADYASLPTPDILIAFYAFFIQIYCDFSGYSDMARGLSKMMGVELMINFRTPFCAERPSDFWSRWHISLTSFVRDYLFVSIGGIRKGTFRMNLNVIVIMTVIGLWHGARWTFVLWGFYFGVLQVAYNLIHPLLRRLPLPKTPHWRSAGTVFNIMLNTAFIVITACLFRAENLHHTAGIIKALGNGFFVTPQLLQHAATVLFLGIPMGIIEVANYRSNDLLWLAHQKSLVRFTFYAVAILMALYIYFFTGDIRGGEEFIYFQF